MVKQRLQCLVSDVENLARLALVAVTPIQHEPGVATAPSAQRVVRQTSSRGVAVDLRDLRRQIHGVYLGIGRERQGSLHHT